MDYPSASRSMLRIDVANKAEEDLDQIADYTTRTWGWRQTDIYLAKLEDGVTLLAQAPSIGRLCEFILPGLRRFEVGKHVVFYCVESETLWILRILHQQMVPLRAHFES
jgi:toxin ParE1/3/4